MLKTEKRLSLHMGCLSPQFVDQLKEQGLKFKDPNEGDYLQSASDSASSLYLAGLVTDGEVQKIRQRIMKKVAKSVVLCEAP